MKQSDKDLPTAEDVRGIIPLTAVSKPTPAQIEAAARVIADSSMIDSPKLPVECWLGLAESVLTAAAEVEPTIPTPEQIEAAAKAMEYIDSEQYKPNWYRTLADHALTAAAEVGETTREHIARDIREGRFPQKSAAAQVEEKAAEVGSYSVAEVDRIVEQTTAATIERCAQVAEQNHLSDQVAIAAAIRKLKDEK